MSKRIIALAPHTDDGELGCGGAISKLLKHNEIFYVAFSTAEESVPEPFPKDILKTEVKKATKILGIKDQNLILFSYKVRHLSYHRQEILDDLVRLNNDISPYLIFMPSLNDLHQDHITVANEGLRAFKRSSILCYEIPWNNLDFQTQSFIKLSDENINIKIKALNCYVSQKNRSYLTGKFIRSLALTRGIQIGAKYAEVFEVVRWIL